MYMDKLAIDEQFKQYAADQDPDVTPKGEPCTGCNQLRCLQQWVYSTVMTI